MKNNTPTSSPAEDQQTSKEKTAATESPMTRRKFVEMTAISAAGFTILPRHVLGGKNFIAPSDKITLAYIGTGTQGIRELLPMLAVPQIQVVSVCDPNKEARGYRDWGTDGLKNEIRNTIQDKNWTPGGDNVIPGGRDNGKAIVDAYYTNVAKQENYKGCSAYADVRELLDKEKGIDAVKIMTPDHLHANDKNTGIFVFGNSTLLVSP